jgi:hypothetical protein
MIRVHGHLISLMVLFCVALHLCWAAILLVDTSAIGATPVAALRARIGDTYLVWTLLAAAGLASLALWLRRPWIVLLLLPQQILLAISAEGAASAILLAQFADGVIRPRAFIAADQLYVILAAIGHAAAMLVHTHRPTA